MTLASSGVVMILVSVHIQMPRASIDKCRSDPTHSLTHMVTSIYNNITNDFSNNKIIKKSKKEHFLPASHSTISGLHRMFPDSAWLANDGSKMFGSKTRHIIRNNIIIIAP